LPNLPAGRWAFLSIPQLISCQIPISRASSVKMQHQSFENAHLPVIAPPGEKINHMKYHFSVHPNNTKLNFILGQCAFAEIQY
jgi:hypothetical protein